MPNWIIFNLGQPQDLRSLKRIGFAIIVVAGVGLMVPSVAYIERGPIGIRFATDYLARRGIPAVIHLDRLDWRGASGSVVLGRASHPDLTVEHFDFTFSAPRWFRGSLAAPRVEAIRLVNVRLSASWRRGRLQFGSLQPLIDDATTKPGRGGGPDVAIEDAEFYLATLSGLLRLTGEGRLVKGRLTSAKLSLAPVDLAGPSYAASGLSGNADLTSEGSDRLHVRLHMNAATARDQQLGASGIDLRTILDLPYGPGATILQGRLSGQSRLTALSLTHDGVRLNKAVVDLRVGGTVEKTTQGEQFTGPVSIVAGAASGDQARTQVIAPNLQVYSPSMAVTIAGKAISVAGAYSADLEADHGRADMLRRTLQLSALTARGEGRVNLAPNRMHLAFRGGASVHGGLSGANARFPVHGSSTQAAQTGLQTIMARNLRSFDLHIPSVAVDAVANRMVLTLLKPAELTFAAGAVLHVSAKPDAPLLLAASQSWSGGLETRLDGPGLPSLRLVSGFSGSSDRGDVAIHAAANLQASGSAGNIRGASLLAPLSIDLSKSGLVVTVTRCADFKLEAYQLRGNLALRSAQAQLCPDSAPLLKLSSSAWTLAARVQGLAGELPGPGLDLKAGQVRIDLKGGGARQPKGYLQLVTALIADAHIGAAGRFRPLQAAGAFKLTDQVVSGQVLLSLADRPEAEAKITLRHDLVHAQGSADVSIPDLEFQPKTLQPASLSPTLAALASQVNGRVAFAGHFGWRDGRLSSDGRLSTASLDLRSPAGQITGLRANLRFSSLVPLILPAQTVTADGLQTLLPLTALSATFGLTPTAFDLVAASATVAKGRASLGPARLPLSSVAARPTISDTLTLKGVDFQDLVSSLNLGKSVSIQAKISGAAPFTIGSAGIRIVNGRFSADGPGRLSIRREALTSAVATGGAAGAQPNAVQDFAYQALENLAFDQLDAAVASRPKGRLGVVLHVKGRHDPPTDQPSRIGLIDLLRGHAFDKPIPLPKATPVDLTLDTSLNFDELMQAYAGLNGAAGAKAGGSVAVQP